METLQTVEDKFFQLDESLDTFCGLMCVVVFLGNTVFYFSNSFLSGCFESVFNPELLVYFESMFRISSES